VTVQLRDNLYYTNSKRSHDLEWITNSLLTLPRLARKSNLNNLWAVRELPILTPLTPWSKQVGISSEKNGIRVPIVTPQYFALGMKIEVKYIPRLTAQYNPEKSHV
jgi:hypothetical protein